jgi:dTDP-4-amino-4,6-dideoxygalactose transaminase
MNVPFGDLAIQYQALKPEIDLAIAEVLRGGNFIGGDPVKSFEKNFAALCQSKNCVSLGNATNGLFLALKAKGIGPGDEVITPAWSWISTSEVITLTGATPVFVDVDPEYFTVTEKLIKEKLTPNTKAVIIVHLYGQMAEVNGIAELCKKVGLFLIEDCSQAHLSMDSGKVAGTIGDCGVFSFYPSKNLGAYGDAGAVITNEDVLAEKVRRWANHGGLSKDDHPIEGFNSRMDTIQAAILNVKLNYLKKWNDKRIANAQLYYNSLSGIQSIELPAIRRGTHHTFHLFVIKVAQRDELKSFLESKGVQTSIHYPSALPFEPAYQYLSHVESDFPVAAQLQNSVLSLPISPEISEEQILYVGNMIKLFYERN